VREGIETPRDTLFGTPAAKRTASGLVMTITPAVAVSLKL